MSRPRRWLQRVPAGRAITRHDNRAMFVGLFRVFLFWNFRPVGSQWPRVISVTKTDSARSCYCGNSLSSTAGLTKYPDSDCNIPCPGDPSETCGGNFANDTSRRRQSIILLTTYNNTVNINAAQPSSSTTPPLGAPSGVSLSTGTMSSSVISPSAGLLSSSAVTLSPSGANFSGASGAGGIPTSVGPGGGSQIFDQGTSSTKPLVGFPGSSIPSSSAQSIPIVISSEFHPLRFK